MTVFPEPPASLLDREIWICWRYEVPEDRDDPTKVPIDPETGRKPDPTDEETGTTFENAVACHENDGVETEGIGFIFSEDDTIAGIDIDDGRDKETGEPKYQWVRDALDTADTYTEVSPSGGGYHLILFGFKPGERCRTGAGLPDDSEVEMYDKDRFFTYTGEHVEGTPETVEQRHQELGELYEQFFGDGDDSGTNDESNSDDSDESGGNGGGGNDEDDDDILEKARAAKNSGKFAQLYDRGSTSGYESHSEARQALTNLLAFWTNGDKSRMRSLFEDSELAKEKPEKSMRDFDNYAADKALKKVTDGYDPENFEAPATDGGATTATPTFESPGADSDDEPTGTPGTPPADAYPAWDGIRQQYAGQDTPKGVARSNAAGRLLAEHAFITDEDENVYLYHEDNGLYERGGERDIKQILVRELGANYTRHEYREILDRVRAITYTDSDEFDAGEYDHYLLCVGNGVLDLETFELLDHSPKYKFTRGIPVNRDPDAECPNIDGFMDDITRREEDKLTLCEMVGNSLLPHYDYESFMILFGGGRNGKTTFSELMVRFLGKPNVTGIELQDLSENRFKMSSLEGKMANVAADISGAKINDMSNLKKLTGNDLTNVERKGEDDFDFYNRAKLIFGANEPPVLGEVTDAIKERLLPIYLPYKFISDPDPDNEFEKQKIEQSDFLGDLTTDEELSGLLNEAIDGIKRLRERGDFSLPESPDDRLAFYNNYADPIFQFANTSLDNKRGAKLPKPVVFDTYRSFCEENGYHITTRNVFWRQLRRSMTVDIGQSTTLTADDGATRYLKNTALTDEGIQYANPNSLDEYDLIPDDGIHSSRQAITGILVAHGALDREALEKKATEAMPANVATNAVDMMLEKGSIYQRPADGKIALPSD